ncbi:unnamed protein product [Caenorhabditis brenneri]
MNEEEEVVTYVSGEIPMNEGKTTMEIPLTDYLNSIVELTNNGRGVAHFWQRYAKIEESPIHVASVSGRLLVTIFKKPGNAVMAQGEAIVGPVPYTHLFQNWRDAQNCVFSYILEYTVTKRTPSIEYELRYPQSILTDACFEVEGKLFYLNRGLLSVFSEYFRNLFSGTYIDGSKPIIPLGLANLREFGLMLNVFYPPQVEDIQDCQVEALLELSIRFQIPAVRDKVERHLLRTSYFEKVRILELAERNHMPEFVDAFLKKYPPSRHTYRRDCDYYNGLSDATKAKLA